MVAMEFFIIGWVAYLIYIATRTEEQRQVHLLLLWGSMIAVVVVQLVRACCPPGAHRGTYPW
jgi:hypothetical protein